MNQKVMKITFRHPGEVNNGDVLQCPLCRKKFIVLPGTQQYRLDGAVDVKCSNCARPTPESYYKELSSGEVVELPQKRRRRNEEVE